MNKKEAPWSVIPFGSAVILGQSLKKELTSFQEEQLWKHIGTFFFLECINLAWTGYFIDRAIKTGNPYYGLAGAGVYLLGKLALAETASWLKPLDLA